jgi:AmmeMemoRadiSam system protein A
MLKIDHELIPGNGNRIPTSDRQRMSITVSSETRDTILRTAREAIMAQLVQRPFAPPTLEDTPAVTGVFVTLRVSDSLRGCIGFLELRDGLLESVAEAARTAATRDARFRPLETEELPHCRIDVTLLGAPERITDAHDFSIGRHGLIMEYGGSRGLLLPQVAVERGWDRDAFLTALCRKAGLADTCWMQPDAKLHRFEGTIICEGCPPGPPQGERRQ